MESATIVVLEIVAIILLILLNGFFALAELSIVSSRKSLLSHMARRGNKNAAVALELANTPESFLSTVQVGITLVGVLAGAFGGATLAGAITAYLRHWPVLVPYASIVGIGLVVLAITYFSLIIGELVPKHLALSNPERLACVVARPVRALSRIAGPLVNLLVRSTSLVFKLFRIRTVRASSVTDDEIRFLMDQGTRAGTLNPYESFIIKRVLRFADKKVSTVMTPRTRLRILDGQATESELRSAFAQPAFSRYLVYERDPENIIGYVDIRDVLLQLLAGAKVVLPSLVKQPLFVTETMSAVKLLSMFRTSGVHIAVVVDEHGSTLGIVTPADILEAILGDFLPQSQATSPNFSSEAPAHLIVDGLLPVDDFADAMDISIEPEEQRDFQTVGGLVLYLAETIPQRGQAFEWKGVRLTVLDIDGVKIKSVKAQRVGSPS